MLSTRQLCTFYLNGFFLGVDVKDVQEVIRYQEMTNIPLAPSVIEGLINLRGQIVVAVDLRRRLKLEEREIGKRPMNVVIRTGGGAVSLLVDEIGDVQEVDEADFETAPETMESITRELIKGVFKLKGKLLLVLDTERTISMAGV